uniref:efflux RND transporter periplasmic adaptor subunit n=1 Tax=Hydrogenophaga sp. TaxID=1904254 RepID=UPI00356335E6
MKLKNLLLGGVLVAVLVGSGHFLYRLGAQQAVRTNPAASSASGAAMEGAVTTADPSNWGIPEGEAATRRHMDSGIRAGVVDPLTGRQVLYYHDPMVPGKQFEVPGKSPFMDMMLVPAYAGSEGADSGTVRVSPRIQQNLGLRSAVATEGALVPAVRAVGAIAWNERDQAVVQARALAYVERLHVRAVLDPVQKGQALAELYVPDWVAAQQEFLAVRRMSGRDLAAMVDAARSRMRQAGMDEAQIHRVESSGEVQARVTLRSPLTGVLTELMVSEGTTLMPGMGVVRINGVSTVWAHAEVPESQLALLQPGARVVAQTPALAGQSFEGRVAALLPQVNPKTRTLKVRMEIANPRGQLVPGMFVQMELAGQATERAVLVPTEAVIQTGKRSLVMLAEEQGRFRPVEVEIGTENGGQTEIRRG